MDTTPNIVPTESEKPVAAPQVTPQATNACPKKKCCGAAILLLTLLVLAGAGASVFFFMESQNRDSEITKLRNTIKTYETAKTTEPDTPENPDKPEVKESGITTELIQNLIDPYLVDDGAYSKAFAKGFNEELKVKIAFYNLNPYSITESGPDSKVYANYYALKDMYNKLFGSEKEIEKKNYGLIEYEEQFDRYSNPAFAWGGAGRVTVVSIKDYEVNGDEITVDVVYDNPTFCRIIRETNEGDLDYCVESAEKEAVAEFIDKAKAKMPVYRFTFEKDTEVFDNDINADNGRYVLKNIEQQ